MKINLGVIFYGNEGQYAINLQQVDFWQKELSDFNVFVYDFNKNDHSRLLEDFQNKKIDIVVKNSYGRANESKIESWLELNGIPFFGSDSLATTIGTNKFLSKELFAAAGIKVPPHFYIDKFTWASQKEKYLNDVDFQIGYPFMLKECGGTDSRGIYEIADKSDWLKRVDDLLVNGLGFIIEKKVDVKLEITCLVGGRKNIFVCDPVGFEHFGTPEEAANKKDNLKVVIKEISVLEEKMVDFIKHQSLLAHEILKCRDFSRADFLYDGKDVYMIEVDVHPGFRAGNLATISIEKSGLNLNSFFIFLYRDHIEQGGF